MSSKKRKLRTSDKIHSEPRAFVSSPSQKKGIVSVREGRWKWIFITIFFFSGLCGLIYEVVWSRLLTLVFGNTTYAISTVIGVFMLGLAVGSYVCGRFLPKIKNHLMVYALLEIGIGVYAALSLSVLSGIQGIHSTLFPSMYDHPLLLNLTRVVLSFLLLTPPTLLMGATLPLLGHALARSPRFVGRDIGILYAMNTFGAATGCFISAFLLIPSLGIHGTILGGAGLNAFLGLITWRLSQKTFAREMKDHTTPVSSPTIATVRQSKITERQSTFILFVFMASGFLALVYEVAWTRSLILVFGSSIYAFATILTTYLFGLALGSIIIGRFTDRVYNPILLFMILQMIIGGSVFLTTPLIGTLPDYFLNLFSNKDISWEMVALREFIVCFLIIIVPTFASGASFPLVTRIFTDYKGFRVGRTVADIYALNTVGGILGSLAAGFFFIPEIGVEKTLLVGGGLNFGIASLLGFINVHVKRPVRLAVGVGSVLSAIIGVFLLPSWNIRVLNSGVFVYAKTMMNTPGTTDINSFMSVYKVLYHREGSSATVTVFQKDNIRFLRINGKTDGSNSSDNYTEVFLGLLPIMYSKRPENALVIGLGTGITLGSVSTYPMKKIDCVEISPEVVEASRYFNEDNNFALQSPVTRLHILDGRTWLMAIPETYDLITSEPSHPWQTGNSNLFTIEFFNLVATRLKKEGVFCQWLPIYHMEPEHFRLLVSSFNKVFPYVHIWMANTDALLIGSRESFPSIDYVELQKRMATPKIKHLFAKLEIHTPEDFLSFFYLDQDAVTTFIQGVTGVNSDNYPIVEFSAPKYLLEIIKPDTFFSFVNLSYNSQLPLVNAKDLEEIHRKRLDSRVLFFRQWRIPEEIIQQMLSQNPLP